MIHTFETNDSLSRRERERAQHRAEIMDAAIDVFGEKGFFTATLDEIAQRAEFSKGTLYLYFDSKEDLLFSILKESLETWATIISGIMESDRSFREQATEMFTTCADYLFEQPRLFNLMSAQHGSFFKAIGEENRGLLKQLHNSTWEQVNNRVVRAIEHHELRDVCPEMITGVLHGAMDNLIHTRWDCETKDCNMEAIDTFMDIIFNGIALERSGI